MALKDIVLGLIETSRAVEAGLVEKSLVTHSPCAREVWNAVLDMSEEGAENVSTYLVLLRQRRDELSEWIDTYSLPDREVVLKQIQEEGLDKAEAKADEVVQDGKLHRNNVVQAKEGLKKHMRTIARALEESLANEKPRSWGEIHDPGSIFDIPNAAKYFTGFVEWSNRYSSSQEMVTKNSLDQHGGKTRLWKGIISNMPWHIKSQLKSHVDDEIPATTVRKAFERASSFLVLDSSSDNKLFSSNEPTKKVVKSTVHDKSRASLKERA